MALRGPLGLPALALLWGLAGGVLTGERQLEQAFWTSGASSTGNWCPSGCLTAAEAEYLKYNETRLKKGLAALRRPGCVPRGRLVVAAGFFRTGSTLLFNVARLWLGLADPSLLAVGYDCGNGQNMMRGVLDRGPANRTVLCKEHKPEESVLRRMDVLLMSRRSTRETLCSRVVVSQEDPSDSKIVRHRERESLCRELMKQQAMIYEKTRRLGKWASYDMLLSDFQADSDRETRAVTKALGICKEARNDKELLRFTRWLSEYLPNQRPSKDLRTTQMHPPLSAQDKTDRCGNVKKLIDSELACRAWALADSSVYANAEYHADAEQKHKI